MQVRIRRRKQKIIVYMIVYENTGGDNCAETGFLDRLSLISSPIPALSPTASLVQATTLLSPLYPSPYPLLSTCPTLPLPSLHLPLPSPFLSLSLPAPLPPRNLSLPHSLNLPRSPFLSPSLLISPLLS